MIDPRAGSLENWTSSLQIDFPADNVPIFVGGEWKDWATRLLECPSFADQAIPDPLSFDDWREWASRVFQFMG